MAIAITPAFIGYEFTVILGNKKEKRKKNNIPYDSTRTKENLRFYLIHVYEKRLILIRI